MTEQSFETEMSVTPLPPKPAACEHPTIASIVVQTQERPLMGGGTWTDRWVDYWRSCGHGPVHRAWRIPWVLPEIGEPALSCLGPPVVTAESGRADKSKPPLRKGRGWRRVKGMEQVA